jgi:hypothetical protein
VARGRIQAYGTIEASVRLLIENVTPEEVHGWGWKETIHAEDLASLMDKWQALLPSGPAKHRI